MIYSRHLRPLCTLNSFYCLCLIDLRLDNSRHSLCHIVEHRSEPGLPLRACWRHIDFQQPQFEMFINSKIEAEKFKVIRLRLNHFTSPVRHCTHNPLNLGQEVILPGNFFVFSIKLQIANEIIRAHHKFLTLVDAVVGDMSLDIVEHLKVKLFSADSQVSFPIDKNIQGFKR